MKKKVSKKKFRLVSIVVSLLLLLSIFGIVTASATEPEGDETVDNFYPYGIRPYLEQFSYDVGDEISINVVVDADCNISSFSTAFNGFAEEDTLTIVNDTVKGSMICDGTVEAPQFSITVVLENGKQLQASIYGFVCDETVYINVNSLFGAKDIYWSEMLASGARTEEEYKSYMAEVSPSISPSISPEYISIGGSASTTAFFNSVRVFGVLQWKDDWGNLHPLRYTKLRVSCSSTPAYALNPNLGVTYTDANGYFSTDAIVFVNTFITLDVYPEGKNTVVKTGAGAAYLYSDDIPVFLMSSMDVSMTFDMSTELGRAFQISQAVIAAAEFAETVNGEDMAPVTVSYPHINNRLSCYYDADGDDYHSGPIINILGEDEYYDNFIGEIALQPYSSWDTIMHEYFHHVQHQYSITDSPGGWHSSSYNMYDHYLMDHSTDTELGCKKDGITTCANPPASLAKEYAIKIAYSEAVATVLGGIAQEYLIKLHLIDSNIVTVGDANYQSYCVMENDYEGCSRRLGEANEATVAAILWDIYDDDSSETHDTLSLGYQSFWDALIQNQGKTLFDFINAINSSYPGNRDGVGQILTRYVVAPKQEYMIKNKTLYSLPTFDWYACGVLTNSYENVTYELSFYNQYKNKIISIEKTDTIHTLTANEWNTILDASGDVFYWTVSAYHDDGYNCVTGPYTSAYTEVQKPTATTITVENSLSGNVEGEEKYTWFKFVAPTSGNYKFYTESNIDTYGEIFKKPLYGLSNTSGRLIYSDDGEEGQNFAITYELNYKQTVYVRVSGEGVDSNYIYALHVELVEHIHNYTAKLLPNDISTHLGFCDCGISAVIEHEWENLGGTTIRCIICKYRYSEQIPGGEIQGGGDGTAELQGVYAILPSETWSDEEE